MSPARRTFIRAMVAGGVAAAIPGARRVLAGRDEAVSSAVRASRPAVRLEPPEPSPRWVAGTIGATALGTPIQRWSWLPPDATVHVLVIAGIHGDERIVGPLADALRDASRPAGLALSIVPVANPDGWAAGTRANARGVDLNRNFPWFWGPGKAGPSPGSEAETQALIALITGERPDLVVWIHQPLGYVAPLAGCPERYASLWADAAGVRVRTGIRHLGGGETWTAEAVGVRSLLVEVTSWSTDARLVADHVRGFEALLPAVEPGT